MTKLPILKSKEEATEFAIYLRDNHHFGKSRGCSGWASSYTSKWTKNYRRGFKVPHERNEFIPHYEWYYFFEDCEDILPTAINIIRDVKNGLYK